MFNIKNFVIFCVLALSFSACTSSKPIEPKKTATKSKPVNFLMETKDINDINELEVSNNLIQVLPVITISGVEVLVDEHVVDQKPILFRNKKCIFTGVASAEPTSNRIDIKVSRATCRTSLEHKVNYEINGWILGNDQSYGLNATKNTQVRKASDGKEIIVNTLSVKKGRYVYLSIDTVKQLETLIIKDMVKKKKNPTKDDNKITKIQR